MQDQLPGYLVDAQYVAAGLTLMLAVQQLVGWRRARPARSALWSGLSAASFTATLLVNCWVIKAPADQLDLALLVRSVLLIATLTVQVPAIAALVGRPTPWWGVVVFLTVGTIRLGLWLTTDTIYAHRVASDGAPIYGALIAIVSVPPVALILAVVIRLGERFDDRVDRIAFMAGVSAAAVVLVASLMTKGAAAELLTGYWIVPWITAVQVIAMRRTGRDELAARLLTERQLAISNELVRTEQRSTLALSAGGMGWYEWDPETRALAASEEFAGMLGVTAHRMPSTIDALLDFVHDDDRLRIGAAIQTTPTVGREAEEFRVVRADGMIIWLEAIGRTMQGPDGRVEVFGVVRDVTDRKVAHHELTHLATHDPLTGLPNRAALALGLREALSHGEPFALLLMDLDGFKDVNDTLGHPIGDEVLVAVARRLESVGRMTDLVARIGGDEFALIVADRPETAGRVVEHVHAVLEPSVVIGGVAITVRASVGVVHGPVDGADADTLLRRADAAMYRAKGGGGGTHVYAQGDDLGATRRLRLAGQLQGALAEGEIGLHYQPTIDITSGRCATVEALARWRHPELGLISPAEFVPLAEHYGHGLALARLVLAEALATCSQWRSEGLASSIAVNVSPRTLRDPSFVGHVATALTQARLPADALTIELTEDSFAEDSAALRTALGLLRDLGVQLAIDDFGTGYSSLAYLERLPVHVVKLDRVFAAGLSSDGANDAIVALSIEMAHRLGLTVVAEGIERQEALAALARYGCDAAQGYLICHPAPKCKITAWLMDNLHSSRRANS